MNTNPIVMWWILLVVFGVLGIFGLRKFIFASVVPQEMYLMVFSIIVAAVAAGQIF